MTNVLLDVEDPPIDPLDVPEIKDIPGIPGYRACTDGRIWSCKGNRWLTPYVHKKTGYVTVKIYGQKRFVHHLVLFVFVGPKPDGMQCRHLDNTPGHNALSNLAWGTHEEDEQDKIRNGTHETCKTHCPAGHEYTPENTWVYKNSNGGPKRMCKTCSRKRSRARMLLKRKNRDRQYPI